MALGLIGLLDLSIVTDRLVTLLKNAMAASPLGLAFPINISGSAPDSVRQSGICELSLYLFHIAADKYQRNSPVTPPRLPPPFPADPRAQTQVPVIPFQPLSLDLFYLLTAFAATDYVHEQQVMSVALKCFHENPIVRTNVTIEGNTDRVDVEEGITRLSVTEQEALAMAADGRMEHALNLAALFLAVSKRRLLPG